MLDTQFKKLEKINEYAKTLGMTIYSLDYGFQKDGKELIHKVVGVNKLSDRYIETLNNKNLYTKDHGN